MWWILGWLAVIWCKYHPNRAWYSKDMLNSNSYPIRYCDIMIVTYYSDIWFRQRCMYVILCFRYCSISVNLNTNLLVEHSISVCSNTNSVFQVVLWQKTDQTVSGCHETEWQALKWQYVDSCRGVKCGSSSMFVIHH